MTAPWDAEALWIKAKLFINRAHEDRRSFDERAMWASLALELLGKSALSRTSPLLIASPTEDGKNLLIATGLVTGQATFKSVTAKTVYERCSKAFKPFDCVRATRIAESRNAYLHGADPGFAEKPEEVWWPEFWGQAQILVEANDQDLHGFVGPVALPNVEKHLEKNKEHIKNVVQYRIARATHKWELLSGTDVPETNPWLHAGLTYSTETKCPVCGRDALAEGEDAEDISMDFGDYSDYLEGIGPTATGTVHPVHFSCPTCGLTLDSWELVHEAGLDEPFEVQVDPGVYEPDYGND